MSGAPPTLKEILFHKHLLNERSLVNALKQQLILGGRLDTNLVELGYVHLDDIGDMLAMQHDVPHAGTRELRGASLAALTRVDPAFCFRHQILPLAHEGNLLHLALSDPRPERVIALSDHLKQKIVPYVTPELRLFYYLEEYYRVERPKRYLRVPDGGESFSRRRHYLFPTIDPLMANVLSGSLYAEDRSPFDNDDILIISSAPADTEGPVDPVGPDDIQLISLDERGQPGSGAVAGVVAPAPPREDAIFEVTRQLETARSSAEVAHLLARPLYEEAALSILFWVRGTFAVSCLIEGPGARPDQAADPVVSLEHPSILQLAYRRGEMFCTAGADDTLQLLIADHLGLPPPGEACVVPVTLFGRVVYLLCLQSRPRVGFPEDAAAQLRLLAGTATAALERLCARL